MSGKDLDERARMVSRLFDSTKDLTLADFKG